MLAWREHTPFCLSQALTGNRLLSGGQAPPTTQAVRLKWGKKFPLIAFTQIGGSLGLSVLNTKGKQGL